MTYELKLKGLTPVPIADYLAALGVFRLVSEQADESASGYWENEQFVLETELDQNDLVNFFLQKYSPTPIVTPWNGGSGFWEKDNKAGITAVRESQDSRLQFYREAIEICAKCIQENELSEAPVDEAKIRFVNELRGKLSDIACRWLDGAVLLTSEKLKFPPLLGTGGNDGRLDFAINFMRWISMIMDEKNAESNSLLLNACLFETPCPNLESGPTGQFLPSSGGANAGIGFEEKTKVNPWTFILTVEGSLLFAASAARRHGTDHKSILSYPFTTSSVGAGSGSTIPSDEKDSRNEFWAPLWTRPSSITEIKSLMSEGRAVVDGKTAGNGLDFARAAGQLGVARGISEFQRYGFLQRNGKAYLATPLSRVKVHSKETFGAELVAELNGPQQWLNRIRQSNRDANTPQKIKSLGHALDDALFNLINDHSANAVQKAMILIGELVFEIGNRPNLQKNFPILNRALSSKWSSLAEDNSDEFQIAASIASLGPDNVYVSELGTLKFLQHIGPIEMKNNKFYWSSIDSNNPSVIWSGRNLISDLGKILERRLLDADKSKSKSPDEKFKLPLKSRRFAPLASITRFLSNVLDDERIGKLAVGLALTELNQTKSNANDRDQIIPFAYAALKPLFSCAMKTHSEKSEEEELENSVSNSSQPNPIPIIKLLLANKVEEAVTRAQQMSRNINLSVPFLKERKVFVDNPKRLVASLLIPISNGAQEVLLNRIYFNNQQEEGNHS